jgi:hypothetical protein
MAPMIKRDTAAERKALPVASGVLDYFPDAIMAVAEVSRVGNEQHHPGAPLHWDKSKSTDEADALMRHLIDRGKRDVDGMRHTAKVAWRALALLQRELDAEAEAASDEVAARIAAIEAAITVLIDVPLQPREPGNPECEFFGSDCPPGCKPCPVVEQTKRPQPEYLLHPSFDEPYDHVPGDRS